MEKAKRGGSANGICGVGKLGTAAMQSHTKAYKVWYTIIRTCYGPRNKGMLTVDERWHIFSNFLEDLPTIEGYSEEDFNNSNITLVRKLLNKESSIVYSKEVCARNTIYSKDTCEFLSDMHVLTPGRVVTNHHGQTFTIVSREIKTFASGKKYSAVTVRMEPTGSIKVVTDTRIRTGGYIKDPFMPSVHGVGYLGTYTGPCAYFKLHSKWRGMLSRCYNPKDRQWSNYGAKGVTVDPSWHCFSTFLEDAKHLDGYDAERIQNGELELDKDLKQQGVAIKVYSKDTCVFLTASENELLAKLKTYKLTSPEGIVSTTTNLKEFCSEHNLPMKSMRAYAYRGAEPKNGWKIEKIE